MLIATAGHVDHGKTTLVKALTGVDTDLLPEEKNRGLSIDLGFAYTTDQDGHTLGFIDVPGHEKFIRNMAAGVGAIDVALLVVAADDGIMPQTREHVAILDLLGITRCVVAITRVDLVDPDTVAQVTQQVRDVLAETALDVVTSQAVSVPENIGVAALEKTLFELASTLPPSNDSSLFRLAVDRSFSVAGFGTVVTGAVVDGIVNVGDTVRVLPGNNAGRIRSMRVNSVESTSATAGQRAALNITKVDTKDVGRGCWITSIEQDTVSRCVDVCVSVLASELRPLRHWTPVHVHAGTAATVGRVALYDVRTIQSGATGYAQLVLDAPMHLVFEDRFVLRDQTATRTIGGGFVIDPFANRHRSFRKNRGVALAALRRKDHKEALMGALDVYPEGLMPENFRLGRNIGTSLFEKIVNQTDAVIYSGKVAGERLINSAVLENASGNIVEAMYNYHEAEQHAVGIETDSLRALCSRDYSLHHEVFGFALESLVTDSRVERRGVRLTLAGFVPQLSTENQQLLDRLLEFVKPDELKPPSLSALVQSTGIDRVEFEERITPLLQSGHFIRVAENRLFHPQALEALMDIARELTASHKPKGFDARSFRDSSGIGRNITIDVLEYFDRTGVTRRISDRRLVRL